VNIKIKKVITTLACIFISVLPMGELTLYDFCFEHIL
jgi:hypothetical protein